MLRIDADHPDVAERHRRRDRPGRGDDPVTDHPVGGRPKLLHTADRQRCRAGPADPCPHLHQHVAQVDDLGFAGGVVDHGLALGEHRRHEDVLGRPDRREVEPDPGALEFVGARDDAAVLDLAVRAEQAQPGLVHVQRPRPDRVSARQGHHRPLAPRDQRPEHTDRGAELPHRGEIRVVLRLGGRRDLRGVVIEHHLAAQPAQYLGHQRNVENVGAVRDRAGALGEQRGGHQLEHAVFRATHVHFPGKGATTGHHEALAHADQPSQAAVPPGIGRYGCAMAVHLTRIYTRTGDDGTTGLSDFSRVSKNDPRLIAYADCDEANAAIGAALALGNPDDRIGEVLRQVQNDLFDAGADLSTPIVAEPKYPPLRVGAGLRHPTRGLVRRVQCRSAGAEFVHPARRYAARGAAARRPDGHPPRRTLGLVGGAGASGRHQRAAGQIPQPALGPAVHPVAARQPGRRRAVAPRRRR